jgi:predicted PurR-regulated permease PerM
VGLVDNFLRPYLMRGARGMSASLVFFALLGGIMTFGAAGLVVGPLGLVAFLVVAPALGQARSAR